MNLNRVPCPFCYTVLEDPEEYLQEEGSVDLECTGCGMLFRLDCRISVDYTASPCGVSSSAEGDLP